MPPQPGRQSRRARNRETAAGQTPFAALLRLREYLRPYYWKLAAMLAAALISVSTEMVIPLLTKAAIDGPIAKAAGGTAAGQPGASLLLPIALAALALGIIHVGLNFYRRWIQASAVTGLEQHMRDDLYAHLQRLDAGFHDSWQSGQLLSRATTDLSTIRRFAGFGIVFLITNIFTFVVVVLLLIRLNLGLGLLTGCVFLPVSLLCLRFERRYRVLSRRAQDQQGDLATYVEEAATGIRVLKALGRRDQAAAEHGSRAGRLYQTQVSKARLRGTFWASLDLVPNAAIGLVLLLGALAVGKGQLTTGGIVAFITLTLLLVWPIEAMGYILATGQEAATAAQRVYEILDTPPAITDPPGSAAGQAPSGTAALPAASTPAAAAAAPAAARRGLVFDHVAFSYPGGAPPVLRDVSLDLRPGETVALVGVTGSGKTTLLQLVPRLAEVTGGAIRLDGTDIRALPLAQLRRRTGCAFEDPTLFSASVRENVSFGAQEATEEAIEQALAAAQAGFVYDLPWGLDTRIGEQGMALSGGQRQRVALARAILTRPEILIFDDPLSALDVHTEARVTEALGEVLANSTALVVAHRPSTVMLADRVALLADGVIAAQGTHRELLAAEPRYRELMSAAEPGEQDGPGPDAADHGLTGARR
ncbi:MAG TPA: ABC transporter ATP-binding protein [Streptosporangiaceae bacterium]|jgi:ATP-binding cassette subfamily B protein